MLTQATAGVALGASLYAAAGARLPRPRRPSPRRPRLLAAVSVSAAAEEILWRGPTLRRLQSAVGAVPAVMTTSLLFAFAHRSCPSTRARAIYAGLGAVFGTAALRSDGLVVAVAAHVTYDALVLLEEPAG